MAAALIVLSVVTAAVLWCATRIYEHRVKQLYARTLRLRVGSSTFDDVQQLAKDYQRDIEWRSTVCSSAGCEYVIRIRTTLPMLYVDVHHSNLGISRVGTRPAIATATVNIKESRLSHVSFTMEGTSSTGRFIRAGFHAVQDLTMFDKCSNPSLGRNSTYTVMAIPYRGNIQTAFGSRATEQVRAGATDLRIDCFTSAIRGCKDVESLMPRAYEAHSGKPDCDVSFTKECQKYLQELESHPRPWKVESAFYDVRGTLDNWTLTRCGQQAQQ